MSEDKKGFLQDAEGDLSSKRLFGAVLILAGGLLLLTTGIMAIFAGVQDSASALGAGQAMILAGAGLLGIGVLEGVGKK
jgi:hypothetical protein